MKKQHLNYYRSEAIEAYAMALRLSFLPEDRELMKEWIAYAVSMDRIATRIAATPAPVYVALCVASQQPTNQQLSMF